MNRKGFTLVELLVVIGISAMLTSIAITYSSIARSQVALSVEAAKVGGAIYRAKDLSIATYNIPPAPGGTKVCGYGLAVDVANNTYSIFAFHPDRTKAAYAGIDLTHFCPSLAAVIAAGLAANEMASTSPATWQVPIANQAHLYNGGGNTLTAALFYPPDPDTLLTNGNLSSNNMSFLASPAPLSAYISVLNGTATTSVTINPVGQITF